MSANDTRIGSALRRLSTESEEERKARLKKERSERREEKIEKTEDIRTGEADVESAIDTSHLRDLEDEQRRQVLARSDPSVAPEVDPSIARSRERREITAQAGEIETTVATQDIIFSENVAQAAETLTEIKDRPEDAKVVVVETAEGPVEMTKGEYRSFVRDYIDGYQEWRVSATGVVTELGELRSKAFEQLGRHARNISERTSAVNKQKADFNQRLKNVTGGATIAADEPGLTRFEERFGVSGIPGPAAGPAPGSFGEKLKHVFGDPAATAVKTTLEVLDAPFVSATTQVRTRAERLQKEAAEVPSFTGLGKFLEGAVLSTGAAAFDAATLGIRPGLALKSAVSVGLLVTDRKTQKAVVEKVTKDPFTFAAEIAGTISGAALGAKLANIGRDLGPLFRTARAEFKVSGIRGVPRAVRAVSGRGTARLDFNKLIQEEIELFRFPEETIQPEFLRTFGPETTFEAPEAFGLQPFKRTTLFKPRLQGQLFAPSEVFKPSTIFRFKEIPLNIPSGRAAIPITISQIASGGGLSFAGILAGFNIQKVRDFQRLKSTQIQRPGTVQQNLARFNQRLSTQTRNIMAAPKLISRLLLSPTQIQPQIQPQVQRQPQRQRQPTIQRTRLRLSQIQIPQLASISGPTPGKQTPAFFFAPPPRSRTTRTVLDFDPRKKKKKQKKGRKVRKKVEKRTTPLDVINFNPLKGIKR